MSKQETKALTLYQPTRQVVQHAHKNVFKSFKHFIYCDHERKKIVNPKELELVPHWKKGKDKITIDSREEIAVVVTDTATNSTQRFPAGGQQKLRKYTFECDHLKPEGEFFFKKFWKSLKDPRKYDVYIQDSENTKGLQVKVYCPDEYKLVIKFPALRGFSRGSKMGIKPGDVKEYLQNKPVRKEVVREYKDSKWSPLTSTSWQDTRRVVETSYNYRTTIKPEHDEETKSKQAGPIVLTRNRMIVEINSLKFLGSLLELADTIYSMYKKVKEDIPQVGWYVDLDLQLMKGAFEVGAGWREFEDHRAFLWMGVGLDVKIISVSVEIGIGVSGYGLKLQTFGRIEGDLGLEVLAARMSPDMPIGISMPIDGAIEGNLGARFEVRYIVEVEAIVATAIKFENAEASFDVEAGVAFKAEIWWTGVQAKIKTSVGIEAGAESEFGKLKNKSEKSKTLVEKTKLGEWSWPKEKVENPKELSPQEIRDVLKKNFTKGGNVRVQDRGLLWDKSWSMDQIVEKVEAKINQRQHLSRDEKTIDLLAWHIRQELRALLNRSDWYDVLSTISSDRFIWFLERGEFDKILNQYISPTKEVLTQHAPASK